MLGKRRPDIEIVGDELIPLGKVKDFAPYVAKIKSSGADTVLTGNWGSDLALLIKSAEESGLKASFYTNYGFLVGTPRAFGAAGANRVKTVAGWNANIPGHPLERYYLDYKKRYKEDWGFMPYKYFVEMLARAIDRAGSADPVRIAKALEDMRYDGGVGEVWMRADDHQLIMPLYVSTFVKAGTADVKHDADDTVTAGNPMCASKRRTTFCRRPAGWKGPEESRTEDSGLNKDKKTKVLSKAGMVR
jgi:branched-chain amino acid transport system substrate-binding protein